MIICRCDRERRRSPDFGGRLFGSSRGDRQPRRCSGGAEFDRFFARSEIAIEPVALEQARIARGAYRDFGKGRHRAGLKVGDCLAYALARVLDQPLLYKGRDFSHTDLQSALKR
jgi:uncharacterized protein with PIN domain